MKKVRNLVIALLLVCAITVPTLAANANISANSAAEEEQLIQGFIAEFIDKDARWNGVSVADVEITHHQEVSKPSDSTIIDKAVSSGIDNVVASINVSVAAVAGDLSQPVTEFGNSGYIVEAELPKTFEVEPVAEGYDREYYVLREHGGVYTRLPAAYNEETRTVTFSSNQFSEFLFGYTDREKVVEQSQPVVNYEAPKAPAYDDGGPFTQDDCGNVFDRWGNEIYHAPVCAGNINNGGYSLVNTLDK